ncbi:hypothetical protein ALC57_18519, partial [Trachymyrmex cornetzi]
LLDALTKSLLVSIDDAVEARVIALNASTGTVITAVWLKRSPGSVGEPFKVESNAVQLGSQPDPSLPWFENADSSAGLRFASYNSHTLAHCVFTEAKLSKSFHISIERQ